MASKTDNNKKNSDTPTDGLELALQTIKKKFGEGSIFRLSQNVLPEIERIPSGSVVVDRILGGGYARGRIVEIYGDTSTGKSTLCLHAIKEAQKLGLRCAYLDLEHALDLHYASNLGIAIEEVFISQPESGEQGLEIVDLLIRSKGIHLLIVDSVAALTPSKELEGEMGDTVMGLHARLMSKAMRKLVSNCHLNNCTLIFINQTRQNLSQYGAPTTTSGGNALKFFASQRLELKRKEVVTDANNDPVGIMTKVKAVKNKTSPPFREGTINILFGTGLDVGTELLEMSMAQDLVSLNGRTYTIVASGEKIGVGLPATIQALRTNETLRQKLLTALAAPDEHPQGGSDDDAPDPQDP